MESIATSTEGDEEHCHTNRGRCEKHCNTITPTVEDLKNNFIPTVVRCGKQCHSNRG
jgi:hypothetical protein